MHDAHFHFSQNLFKSFQENHLMGICNIENEEEHTLVQGYLQEYPCHTSYGIHPWHVDTVKYASFFPYLEQTRIIGEIGLDNTWCETNLNLQKEVFEKQLAYAHEHHKPVILHLKGMEKEALPFLKKYKNTYLVHWYSCKEYLEEYINLGCYFTVGPSVGIDESVSHLVQKVDIQRLLIESDGISALEWAFETKEVDYISSLQRSIQEISRIKGMESAFVEKQLDQNFIRFIES
ncbi:MAG: TatD family hydrolase [Firmicutes bacterium]|nr:TatD family hydrolase [Bacillota bacterium]